VAVANLSIPILITIPHPPMRDNETMECRYWDPVLLEQRTDGCELVASFTNFSVCACDHLTDFSMGTWAKFKGLEVLVQSPYLHDTPTHIHSSPRPTIPCYSHRVCSKYVPSYTQINAEHQGHEDRGALTVNRTADSRGKDCLVHGLKN
jgi:hypothetical protein